MENQDKMVNVYTQNEILKRNDFIDPNVGLVSIVSARVRPKDLVLDLKLREHKINRPRYAKHKHYHFNLGEQKSPRIDIFSLNSPEAYIQFLNDLGVIYSSEDNGKDISQLCGEKLITYSEDDRIVAVLAIKKRVASAYSMFDLGVKDTQSKDFMGEGGQLWNEVVPSKEIMRNIGQTDYVHILGIKRAEYDQYTGELELDIQKRGLHSDHTFVLSYETAMNCFLEDYGIKGIGQIKELENKKIIVLSADNDSIDWVVPYIS